MYEDPRQKKIDSKSLVLSLSYKYKKKVNKIDFISIIGRHY